MSKKIKMIISYLIALVVAIFSAQTAYDVTNGFLGFEKDAQSYDLSDIGSLTSLEPIIGFFLAWAFFLTLNQFSFNKNPKIYWYILLGPSVLVSLIDWRLFLIQISYILIGFLVGSVIRISIAKIRKAA